MGEELTCAMCSEPIERLPDNEFFPFCSKRCKMEDLGNWLDESYRVPMGPSSTERDPSSTGRIEDDASSPE